MTNTNSISDAELADWKANAKDWRDWEDGGGEAPQFRTYGDGDVLRLIAEVEHQGREIERLRAAAQDLTNCFRYTHRGWELDPEAPWKEIVASVVQEFVAPSTDTPPQESPLRQHDADGNVVWEGYPPTESTPS